ncbi:centromere O [Pelobates cultripes]|uniref:Centromere protein O n=1 Tax=Pelobates cultripes TaxID=61616 RepID=A0AAD1VRA6_PELCU|nr:centromere O [Pelobates cultripes]
MEEAQDLFREGVMSHLEELETLSHNLAMRQEQKRSDLYKMESMKEVAVKLRKEREDLRAKLSLQEAEIQAFTIQKTPILDLRQTSESTQDPIRERELEELKEILGAYWLTGISGKLTKMGACICISTAFEGKYLDSYYLDLVLQKNVRIERHSVPAFIPLDQIAQTHLNKGDLKKFLFVIFEHLNAYSGRKYQADQLQALPKIVIPGTVHKDSLCTLLTFEYNMQVEGTSVCFCAKLLYGDLMRILPTEVKITYKDSTLSFPDTVSSHSSLFSRKTLPKALEMLKSANETLVHSSISLLGTDSF